jgi:predicted membrane metal-binding protein
VTAYNCNAIPGIGVGDKINLDLPKNKMNQGTNARFSGAYVISKIIHRINDGNYTQIIEMARS